MGELENSLNRLQRAGNETSATNKKLTAAADKIANVIPEEWVYDTAKDIIGKDLGDNYYVGLHQKGLRKLYWRDPTTNHSLVFTSQEITLKMARQFAGYIASGWLARLSSELSSYRYSASDLLCALEQGEKNIPI
jgi:hypothetical protein